MKKEQVDLAQLGCPVGLQRGEVSSSIPDRCICNIFSNAEKDWRKEELKAALLLLLPAVASFHHKSCWKIPDQRRFPNLPSLHVGLLAGSSIYCQSVSDLLKWDPIAAPASHTFPRTGKEVDYLFQAPSPSVLHGLQLHHPLYTPRQMSSMPACLCSPSRGTGQNSPRSPTLNFCRESARVTDDPWDNTPLQAGFIKAHVHRLHIQRSRDAIPSCLRRLLFQPGLTAAPGAAGQP